MKDTLLDRCGLFGFFNNDDFDTARMIYYGLFSLQHRGVEAAGICVNNGEKFVYQKDQGLVIDIFNEKSLKELSGHMGIGHVLRYPGKDAVENAQPIVVRYTKGYMALALNGSLTNMDEIRHELELQGAVFQTMEAAEIVAVLISRARHQFDKIEDVIADVMKKVKGGFSLIVMTPNKIIGARDAFGIRPLMLGKKKNSWFLSSETCAFNELEVEFERSVAPGELVVITKNGVSSHMILNNNDHEALCAFEFIYHSRPDSVIAGTEVFEARYRMGLELAKEAPVEADAIVWVPDSGLGAANGYSDGVGIEIVDAFLKNRYFCNKLVKPEQELVDKGINMKLSVIESQIRGKRIAVIDDSMINGRNAKIYVAALRRAGAKEVHLRIAAPLVKYLCLYGAATPDRQVASAAELDKEAICKAVGADSLEFLSIEALERACHCNAKGLCMACFNGNYPV